MTGETIGDFLPEMPLTLLDVTIEHPTETGAAAGAEALTDETLGTVHMTGIETETDSDLLAIGTEIHEVSALIIH